MRAAVVIGSGYGDEGKGMMTDFLSQPGGVVVRFNGGGQAGHTVVTPDGKRHVFSHFGSGSLRGAATHLSQFFICNPIIWVREFAQIEALDGSTDTSVDFRARVTTPYDMMINQMKEEQRGGARHGSCGAGINETMARHKAIPLTYGDIVRASPIETLERIQAEWVPRRLHDLGITPSREWLVRLTSPAVREAFLRDCHSFATLTFGLCDWEARGGAGMVLEGAQGLLLDQDHRFFPHVTHSSTGLTNALAFAKEAGITDLDVVYVTRAYATRHGAGPMPEEDPAMSFPDDTNQPNEWQGKLRFGPLNLDLIAEAIRKDQALALAEADRIRVSSSIALTHIDQMPALMDVIMGGVRRRGDLSHMVKLIEGTTGMLVQHAVRGPTRNDVFVRETTPPVCAL